MGELILHLDNGKTFIYISLAVVIITFITHLVFKKYRYMKYIPGIALIGVGLYSLYQVSNELTDTSSISNLLLFLICFAGGIIALFVGLIIGIYDKPRKIRKSKNKEIEE